MKSLLLKILYLTVLIMVMASILTSWHNLKTQQEMLVSMADQNGRILAETIRSSIATSMLNGQNSEVPIMLAKMAKGENIDVIRVFDDSGQVVFSSDPQEIGQQVGTNVLRAYRENNFSFMESGSDHEHHSSLLPIDNSPSCQGCHDSDQLVLGALNINLSLKELGAIKLKGRNATLYTAGGTMLILILTVTAFVAVYVETPVRKMMAAMDRVERGDLAQAKIEIHSSKEMAMLSSKFNRMVERLQNQLETAIRHEREIAITQQKLSHHDEVRSMNITLEERLKEIEYLNLNLEERIEEIEEANFKIADLASTLEDKNTVLEQAVARLSTLNRLGIAFNSTMDLDNLFELLIGKSLETLQAKIGYILLLDRDAWLLKIGSAIGLPAHIDQEMRIPLQSGGVSHWVIEHRQPLLIADIKEAQRFNKVSPLGFDRESIICAPLIIKDEIIGTITIANKKDKSGFSPDDLELLSTIAAQASIAIKNARLYEEQQVTYLNTVQALVSAIEASDAYTRGHSERVTRYSLAAARQMNLSANGLKRLEQAAILHDIGKIGIDIGLLHKEEKLSNSDIDVLRQHPLIGVRILEPIHFLKNVRTIIEQHHERFDGTGYPYGLKGDELLLEARILAVADTYDAMTSDRPYRKALSHGIAIHEIAEQAGTQFDPQVAEAFIAMFQNGEMQIGT